jgi:hypothetical protein
MRGLQAASLNHKREPQQTLCRSKAASPKCTRSNLEKYRFDKAKTLASFLPLKTAQSLDMKANQLVIMLLLLWSAAVFQLPAQQAETDQMWIDEVIAKAKAGDADF